MLFRSDEKDYIAAKSRFFNLSFADGNIMVRFDRMIEVMKARGKETKWESGEDVREWWTNPEYIHGQLKLVDIMEDDEG